MKLKKVNKISGLFVFTLLFLTTGCTEILSSHFFDRSMAGRFFSGVFNGALLFGGLVPLLIYSLVLLNLALKKKSVSTIYVEDYSCYQRKIRKCMKVQLWSIFIFVLFFPIFTAQWGSSGLNPFPMFIGLSFDPYARLAYLEGFTHIFPLYKTSLSSLFVSLSSSGGPWRAFSVGLILGCSARIFLFFYFGLHYIMDYSLSFTAWLRKERDDSSLQPFKKAMEKPQAKDNIEGAITKELEVGKELASYPEPSPSSVTDSVFVLACPNSGCNGMISSKDEKLRVLLKQLSLGGMMAAGSIPCSECGQNSTVVDWHQETLNKYGSDYLEKGNEIYEGLTAEKSTSIKNNIQCSNCDFIFEAKNLAKDYPLRAQAVEMIYGEGQAYVFQCPNCNMTDAKSKMEIEKMQGEVGV